MTTPQHPIHNPKQVQTCPTEPTAGVVDEDGWCSIHEWHCLDFAIEQGALLKGQGVRSETINTHTTSN